MHIQDAIDRTQTFDALVPFIDNAREDVSFWGFRYITVPTYKGRTSIDALAVKIFQIKHQRGLEIIRSTGDKYARISRKESISPEIVKKLNILYKKNDDRLKMVNCITRLFYKIRQTLEPFRINHCFTLRQQWDSYFEDVFNDEGEEIDIRDIPKRIPRLKDMFE